MDIILDVFVVHPANQCLEFGIVNVHSRSKRYCVRLKKPLICWSQRHYCVFENTKTKKPKQQPSVPF